MKAKYFPLYNGISFPTILKTEFKYSFTEIAEVEQVSGHLRCSNIYNDMHKL